MTLVQTSIAVGHGADVPAALQSLTDQLNKTLQKKSRVQHFTMYHQMKPHAIVAGQVEITHFAVAIIETEFIEPKIVDP